MFVVSNALDAIAQVLHMLCSAYVWIVIIATLLSWVRPDPYNPIVRVLYALTEPVLYRVRKYMPFLYTSGIDFSPLVVIIAVQLFDMIIVRSMRQFAML
jgi:YggT family protein